jgi:RHS repeat-associated protein
VVETKSYSAVGELLGNLHTLGGSTLAGHSYTYDTTSRRTAESFADGTTPARSYGYDLASQVTSATYGGGQADAYAYDPMGNRQTATLASQGGASLTYTANSVNQYTAISAQPAPVHDANGNLTQQKGNSYTWDSENRLLSVVPNTPATGDKSLQYRYDAHHRRVTRTIQEWTGTAWASTGTTHFIYDGWNVIEEYQITSTTSILAKTYTWGLDLSGSLQGAGGVGALLMAEEVSGSTTLAYHYHYDGNGNVTEITDAAGAQAASYRYDAFGNALAAAGPYSAINRYRFSTKPLDAEVVNAPLYYYGYRFYDPVTGRWPSRDLIGEIGGLNLYEFVFNDPNGWFDNLGNQPTQQQNEQRRQRNTDNSNGRNTNATNARDANTTRATAGRANSGSAATAEAAGAAGNRASGVAGAPGLLVDILKGLHAIINHSKLDSACGALATAAFESDPDLCEVCCLVSGVHTKGNWEFQSARLVNQPCDDIRKVEYEKFEKISWIGYPGDVSKLSFIRYINENK